MLAPHRADRALCFPVMQQQRLARRHGGYESFDEVGIDAGQLAAGALCGEHPVDADGGGIALTLPGGDFGDQTVAFADAAPAAPTPVGAPCPA
jgi:hypothetical protein